MKITGTVFVRLSTCASTSPETQIQLTKHWTITLLNQLAVCMRSMADFKVHDHLSRSIREYDNLNQLNQNRWIPVVSLKDISNTQNVNSNMMTMLPTNSSTPHLLICVDNKRAEVAVFQLHSESDLSFPDPNFSIEIHTNATMSYTSSEYYEMCDPVLVSR